MAAALHPAETLAPSAEIAAELAAILHSAAVAPLYDIGWIRVTGSDRVRWLNGMVTNAIQSLTPGEGCYSFVLNAQGRIQGDLTVFLLEDSILLETAAGQIEKLLAHLNHFIIMDDVELADISPSRRGLLVAGPQASSILTQVGVELVVHSSLRLQATLFNSARLDLVHSYSPVVPRIELWSDLATIIALASAIAAAGAASVSAESLEALRILEGTPRYGVDIRNTDKAHDLPQETSQDRALNFAKGCYLGQEIVERIRSRGSVHRTFSGFLLTGELPAPGAELTTESAPRPIGELTSVAAIPLPGSAAPTQLALGYIRREALELAIARGLPLHYPGGTATPAALPFAVS